ncbi:MAG: cupin domain-containing protein [Rhodospirillales bacterium]
MDGAAKAGGGMGRGVALVVQPDEGESFWQPEPANGYAEVRVSKRNDPRISKFSHGIQVIAPGCHVRDHSHEANEELLYFVEGEGKVVIDGGPENGGEEHPIRAGTSMFFGPNRRHTFINTGKTPMKMLWVMMPGGLEDFFEGVGRKRRPGEPAPKPFPRPADVLEIERRTVFNPPPKKPVNR